MTVEAGALSLRISETGAEQVEQKLTAIDRKAAAIGSKTVALRMTAPGIERLEGQLEQLGKQAQLFSTGARFASTRADSLRELGAVETQLRGIIASGMTPLEQRIKAEQTLSSLTEKQPGMLGALQSSLGRVFLAYAAWNTVTGIYDKVAGASDRAEVAQMRLGATAKLTGQSLATVTAISERAQQQFKIGAGPAADLTQQFVKLASRAGDVSKAGGAMTAWMDLAAAQGLPLNDVLSAIQTTLAGNDDGLNRLGLMDPSAIYKKWGDAVGATNGKLDDQQKFQAILNEVMEKGETVRGSYSAWLETTPGKQQQMNTEVERAAAAFGAGIAPMRIWAYELGTSIASALTKVINFYKSVDEERKKSNFEKYGIGPGATKDHVASFELTQNTDLSGFRPKAAPPPAKPQPREETAAERKRRETLEKARGLGDIPLSEGISDAVTPSTPPTVGVDSKGRMKGVKPFDIADVMDKELDELTKKMQARKKMVADVSTEVAGAIGNAFSDAFSSAFSGEDNFFEALGKSLLASLGNILMSLGSSMIAYGAILTPLLGIPGPFMALGLGAAASAAAGIGLVALGAAMGAAGGKGGKGAGGGSGRGSGAQTPPKDDEWSVAFDPDRKLRKGASAVAASARSLDSSPMPEARPVVHIGVINSLHPDDAKWQRALAETYSNARNRGLVRNG